MNQILLQIFYDESVSEKYRQQGSKIIPITTAESLDSASVVYFRNVDILRGQGSFMLIRRQAKTKKHALCELLFICDTFTIFSRCC